MRDASWSRAPTPPFSPRTGSMRGSGASSKSSRSWPAKKPRSQRMTDRRMPDPDQDALGKAYDPRLMRRLWEVTRPHRRLVLLSMLLFPAVAALELLQPWLTKIAIDRYILTGDWPGLSRIALAYLACLLVLYGLRV